MLRAVLCCEGHNRGQLPLAPSSCALSPANGLTSVQGTLRPAKEAYSSQHKWTHLRPLPGHALLRAATQDNLDPEQPTLQSTERDAGVSSTSPDWGIRAAVVLLRGYKGLISPLLPNTCRQMVRGLYSNITQLRP
ncbi:hypothetical protein WJX72_010174 [[Myrmecia] bisecta]|uniref:Uncharacterized protein n=1 Tax=[Myrmecia] bisecta TaxID=41462 RepID=A0AAW1PY41_9CHLO